MPRVGLGGRILTERGVSGEGVINPQPGNISLLDVINNTAAPKIKQHQLSESACAQQNGRLTILKLKRRGERVDGTLPPLMESLRPTPSTEAHKEKSASWGLDYSSRLILRLSGDP